MSVELGPDHFRHYTSGDGKESALAYAAKASTAQISLPSIWLSNWHHPKTKYDLVSSGCVIGSKYSSESELGKYMTGKASANGCKLK